MEKWKNQTRRACNKLQSSGIVCARGEGGEGGKEGNGFTRGKVGWYAGQKNVVDRSQYLVSLYSNKDR